MANRAEYPSLELNKFRKDNYPEYIEALNKGDDKDYLPYPVKLHHGT